MASSTASSREVAASRLLSAGPLERAARRAAPSALLAALLAALPAALPAPAAASGESLASELEAAVSAATGAAGELGVHVVELASGRTVLEREADRPRIVASNVKLVTAAAALELLGPGHLLETRVVARGEVVDGRLLGDLAVIGGGDPNISGRFHDGDSLAVFRGWAAALAGRGVAAVDGDVYLVHGLFEPPEVHPDWPRDQLSRWYEAPVSALAFNDNCVLVRVSPGSAPGRPSRVETVPDLELFEVDNQAATTASSRRHQVAIERLDGSHRLWIGGAVFRRAGPVESWVAVADPLAYFGAALRKALAEEGIPVSGEMRPVARLPPPSLADGAWRPVAVHRSDLLSTLEVLLKRSQNLYAESLTKLLGAERCGEGSWPAGLRVLEEFLAATGIPPGSYRLADGSGMSRHNRMAPRQLTRLLAAMASSPLAREFVLSLPHSGEPGQRWEHRLAELPYRGNVFAKTGSLRGVSTLSGYAKASSGRLYAFSILMNDIRGRGRAQRAQDRIVRVLIDLG